MKENLRKVFFVVAALTFSSLYSCLFDTDDKYDFKNEIDTSFMAHTSINNISTVQAALIATAKATNNDVMNFAKTAIAQRTVAQALLKSIATNENVDFKLKEKPDSANEIDLDQLEMLTGKAFDSFYMHYQLNSHDTLIPYFLRERDGGRNPDLKKYVDSNLPKVQTQRKIANDIINRYFK